MAQIRAGDSYMQPPYQPIHEMFKFIRDYLFWNQKEKYKTKPRPRFSLYKIPLETLVLSD